MRALEQALRAGLGALSLPLDERQIARLLDYLELIQKWNKVYNLTAVRDPAEMLTHHLLDSLALVAPLRAKLQEINSAKASLAGAIAAPPEFAHALIAPTNAMLASPLPLSCLASERSACKQVQREPAGLRLLDVGSGAGLPGVVIAICCPELSVDCVDTVAKKTAFIRQVALGLGLANLHALHARVESIRDKYDVICSRAFASLNDFVHWSSGALAEKGVWLAMKGKYPAEEVASLPKDLAVFHVEQLAVPGLDAQRCLVWLKKLVPAPQS